MKHLSYYFKDKFFKKQRKVDSLERHIHEAANWLLYAFESSQDHGVPHCFDVKANKWWPSYPETTGYIIPTLYDYENTFKVAKARDAALKMSHWESEVQLADGGVRAGHMGAEIIKPTIFNTGQVLFGWARAVVEDNDEQSLKSLINASDWLVDAMDEDGAWRRFDSPFAPGKVKPYNARCAFGLIWTHKITKDEKYLTAAINNINWVISTQTTTGWIPNNCLTKNPNALTHTIAYTMRGILEVGDYTKNQTFIDFAMQMALKVLPLQNKDGSFPGRITPDWQSESNWSCITGNSQLALNFFRLYEITGNAELFHAAVKANRFNMSMQDINTNNLNIRGALKGSHPINEQYMTYRYPNWATKFFIDALMKEQSLTQPN